MRNPAGVNDLAHDHAIKPLDELAQELLFALDHPALRRFRAAWPAAPAARATPSSMAGAVPPPSDARVTPAALPVLDWLPGIAAGRHDFAAPLIGAVCRAAPALGWRQSYSQAQVDAKQIDAGFLRNYGYTEIIGPTASRECRRLSCGFLLLGPHTHYPPHRHEAEEIYVPLSGAARWLQGDGIWREHPPGTIIHHESSELHAMRTTASPLLALYVWRSADLRQTARLVTA